MQGIRGKNVLVTGGSSGIGQAIAVRLGQEGANVAINYRKGQEEAERTHERIHTCMDELQRCNADGHHTLVQGDVASEAEIRRIFETTIRELGGLDILINNAGIQTPVDSHELSAEQFDRVLGVNLRGAFLCAREAIRHLLGAGKPGVIINVSSVHQLIPKPRFLSYSISKGGIQNLTRTLALEYAGRGIRVNGIAAALNNLGGDGISLWDDEDEFFYDVLHTPDGMHTPLKVRSMVGLIPLFAVTTIEPELLEQLPEFRARLEWYLEHRPDLAGLVSRWQEPGMGERRLLALCRGHRMKRVLRRMLDPEEFLSEYGVRSLSRYHLAQPYRFDVMGARYTVAYQPAESDSGLFGGNSNWRGPVWFPVNYLLIEALQQFHHYYGDDFLVECPTGSGQLRHLHEVADELSRRLIAIFTRDESGRRPVFGGSALFQGDPGWRNFPLFYEYFDGDSGAGVGASHQTGWTGLVAKLIHQQGKQAQQAGSSTAVEAVSQ